jgi:acetyl esterase/lipase
MCIARFLALATLVLSALRLVPLKPLLGPIAAILLVPFRLLAEALAPVTALLGAAAGLLGLLRRDPLAATSGATAAALSARYVRSVTAPHDGFQRAFGPHWQRAIQRNLPPQAVDRMLRRRWTWRLPPDPAARCERDLPFWTVPGQDGGQPLRLLCNLWQPPRGTQPSGLAFVFLHGGGWHQYDKGLLTRPFFRHLAGQGHVVMDVAYRLYPSTNLAGMVGDAKRAVAWLKANGEAYGIDPERVVVAGGSAGGHLALMAAYTPGHPELTPPDLQGVDTSVRGVVAFYPVVDLRAYVAYNAYPTTYVGPLELTSPREVVAGLLGGWAREVPDRYDLLSPDRHVCPDCPPTLLLQGGHDHVLPLAPVRSLYRELGAAGVPVVYVEFPATEHAFDLVLPGVSPAAQSAWHDVERFLALLV